VASNLALGSIALKENDSKAAVEYWAEVLKNSEKNSSSYQQAKKSLEDLTKRLKVQKKGKK
jgi:cytochrome c-type biogenesis protein CcmH/NrfG